MKTIAIVTVGAAALVGTATIAAWAQLGGGGDVSPSIEANSYYKWACSNPTLVEPILEWLVAIIGPAAIANAIMKKFGITKDSPVIGVIIPILRRLVLDVPPPPAVMLKSAADVLTAQPEIAAASGASAEHVAAAAVAVANKPS